MSSKQAKRPAPSARQAPKSKQKKPLVTTTTNPQLLAVQEAKQEARRQRQVEALAVARKRRMATRIKQVAIGLAIAVVVVGGITAYYINEANKPGQLVPMQPSPHLATAQDAHAPYTTDPPTSGPHVPDAPSWGVLDKQIAKELQVHDLEDAGVVINYQPNLDKATVDRLAALANSYGTQVLMTPYAGLSNPIVLTAWRRIDRLDTFDEARIKRFINAYKGIDHHGESGS